MRPHRVAPAVAHLGALLDEGLVDLHAQPRPLGDGAEAVLDGQRRRVHQVVQHVVVAVVVDAHALLLDEGVVADRIQLQRGGQGQRAERAVRGERHVMGRGQGGDLHALADAAAVGEVGLDDVDHAVGQQVAEREAGVQPLAGSQRVAQPPGDLFEAGQMLGGHRFLDEHRVEGFQLAQQRLGHGAVHPAVEVDADAHVRPHGVAGLGDPGHRLVHLAVAVDDLQLRGAVHLEGGEALLDQCAGAFAHVGGAIAPGPGVHAHAVAYRAAQQLVHRHAQVTALEVPQRLVDAGDGAHQDRAAAVEAGAIEGVPQVLDAVRVLADQVVGKLMDGGLHGGGAALDDRFAPAVAALVGLDLEEQPARRHLPGPESCDLHGGSWVRVGSGRRGATGQGVTSML